MKDKEQAKAYAMVVLAAKVAHQVNKAYCLSIGDTSQPDWDEAPDWQIASAIDGVRFMVDNDFPPPEASHENWLAHKLGDGWKWGPVKDADKKEHPCMMTYDGLPWEQKAKDHLFRAAVKAVME